MSEHTSKASPDVHRPVGTSQLNHARQRHANSPGTHPLPSKNRSRISTQRWVEKRGRSITKSDTPQSDAASRPTVSRLTWATMIAPTSWETVV